MHRPAFPSLTCALLSAVVALLLLAPAEAQDTTPPTLHTLAFPEQAQAVADSSVNHFFSAQAEATDAGAGVQYFELAYARRANGEFLLDEGFVVRTLAEECLLSGSSANGIYDLDLRVPAGAGAGTYRLTTVRLADASGQIRDYAVDSPGSVPGLAGADAVVVAAQGQIPLPPVTGDPAPPVIKEGAIAPGHADFSSGSAVFAVCEIDVADIGSGVGSLYVWWAAPDNSSVFLTSADATESLTGGNLSDGRLRLRVPFPATAPSGLWKASAILAKDRAGNMTQATGTQFPTPLTFLVHRGDEDGDGRITDDVFPHDPSEWADFDGDGIGDNADTDDDGDGLPDVWETILGLDPRNPDDGDEDPDGDGLTNQQEFAFRTHPFRPDTDGDGILDSQEPSLANTHPTKSDTDGDGYVDGTELDEGSSPTSGAMRPAFTAKPAGEPGNRFTALSFVSRLGATYRIEFTTNLRSWFPILENVAGTGRRLNLSLPPTSELSGYYRVVEQ